MWGAQAWVCQGLALLKRTNSNVISPGHTAMACGVSVRGEFLLQCRVSPSLWVLGSAEAPLFIFFSPVGIPLGAHQCWGQLALFWLTLGLQALEGSCVSLAGFCFLRHWLPDGAADLLLCSSLWRRSSTLGIPFWPRERHCSIIPQQTVLAPLSCHCSFTKGLLTAFS